MSKKDETAYDHITPELVDQVKEIIADSVKHTYSVSKIYVAHNAVFKRKDQPQTCGSCLRNRVRDFKRWLAEYEKATSEPQITPQYDDPAAPGFIAPADGVIRLQFADNIPFDFTPETEGQNKGSILYADGSKVKAGTYMVQNGSVITVQPGGKATIKPIEEDLT